ncbi:2-oxo acid dehydrogenase subunit E2 [Streptomyces sp. NBC_01201]|uniref:Dihydrolipoamide acetyltransferase component of pyruvate dehydrogenase complex n=1 Tax=Streptomyces glycanivorans TaxID=3033808 RepID=A0ABY9JCP5_9ACTN|nr:MULTISPECIES: dihydrolipoamide acetyltransferase family protein [unclassified Streptomyces]WLQ65438.1 dihydrolipoamide acetyltransferase family protein [Streptomyces sp. Alt3]WSR07730.1 2-oxo acid dehydrogenase subunit E2 [Streptomyces sp. NBC_01208]WSR49532.1 2-oxo acid dehydrogenase subunit E2 [Streptomyces sp. NBC_01201]
MAQVLEFKLPDLGEGLTEAEIVRWLVEVGDVVAIDQPVVEVETAKAMVEVPCPYGGVVTARYGEEGAELPVGAPLLTVAVGSVEPVAGRGDSAESADGAAESGASGNVLVGYGTGAPAARRRRVRPAPVSAASSASATPAEASAPVESSSASVAVTSTAVTSMAGTSMGAGTILAEGRTAAGGVDSVPKPGAVGAQGPVAVISPLVRKLARQHGLDLRQVVGTGRDGLILRTDVESAIRTADEEPVAGAEPVTGPEAKPSGERIPLRGVRGVVADKLSRSRREIPDATCWVDADATELMAARAAMNAAGGSAAGPKVSVLALLARICTAALARFPELNSTVDAEAREIVRLSEVHLGFAAQTERGLVVPVVRDAHTRNAESIGAEIARLTGAARDGKLTPAQLTGGTFTLNNYGVFGVDGSTPIINHPEAAMLGVGRIMPKPWVHEGELAVRQVVQLSLTFDHRVCDGGTAGGFLRYVADCVEQPAVLLRTL